MLKGFPCHPDEKRPTCCMIKNLFFMRIASVLFPMRPECLIVLLLETAGAAHSRWGLPVGDQ